MVIGSTMRGEQIDKFAAEMEKQNARVRRTKKGLMVYAPDGGTLTVHTTNGDARALANDIAWFRRHGLHHPADTKQEKTVAAKPAETNEEGYPLWMTKPISGPTRKRVLADLEGKGWPLRVQATELAMDTVTAQRALYNVGYRWDPLSPKRHRIWVAPDDIRELHEKVKAEMDRREREAKEARAAAHAMQEIAQVAVDEANAVADAKEAEAEPYRNPGKTIGEAASPEFLRENARPLPSLDFVKHVGHEGEHHPVLNPEVHGQKKDYALASFPEEPPLRGDLAEPVPTAEIISEEPPAREKPEREFLDSEDSWVITDTDLPPLMTVSDLRWTLEASGLEVEIRVWRKQ